VRRLFATLRRPAVPIILIGGKYVFAALRHYERTGGKEGFVSERDIGLETPYWTEEAVKG